MNKLKNKVFWTLTILLTVFLVSILFLMNYNTYSREKNRIKSSLSQMKEDIKPNEHNGDNPILNDPPKMYMDTVLYTVLLNQKDEVIEVINHHDHENVENIKEVASKFLESESIQDTFIGNLYFDDYSYSYKENKSIMIVDQKDAKKIVWELLKKSILIFLVLESIILYVSKLLTKWMIKPVMESFQKQKRFIADASHELKTPLAVIMASSDALEQNMNEKKWLLNIQTEADRMNKLIKNLLDLARLENASQTVYAMEDLSKIMLKSTLTLESLIYEKDIKLDYEIEDDIKMNCNGEEMKQLVTILLDNAIKHSEKNGHIVLNLKQAKDHILLEVKNKGIPIPKGEEEKIFERFYRADESRNRNENRYGLGLAIAKNITLNHHGKIRAFSKDEYTTFEVIFKK